MGLGRSRPPSLLPYTSIYFSGNQTNFGPFGALSFNLFILLFGFFRFPLQSNNPNQSQLEDMKTELLH